jgi:hypothetical protein
MWASLEGERRERCGAEEGSEARFKSSSREMAQDGTTAKAAELVPLQSSKTCTE